MEFEVDAEGAVQIRKAEAKSDLLPDRFARLIGCATAGLTTDEIMAVTRGED